MAKRAKPKRRVRKETRETNWLVIGSVIAVGAVALFALLYLSLREQGTVEAYSLIGFCQENPENCVSEGAADAPVTIVEVSDYGCSHCQDFNLETAGLIEDLYVTPGQVRWITLPFALDETRRPAAVAAFCANRQERFNEFHRRMFEIQDTPAALTREGFLAAAEELNLDLDAFQSCLDDDYYTQLVLQNRDAAGRAGVTGTPTFFINDQIFRGNQPLALFQQQINDLVG